MSELKYVGKTNAVPVDGLDKVLGKARYVGDIRLPGMLHAKVLRSPIPHGKITQLDASPAMKVNGVHAVITSEDYADHGLFGWPVADAYILAYQKVRYVGDAVAVVAAENEAIAQEGVKAIRMTLEPLPVVSDLHKALQEDSSQVPLDPPLEEHNLAAKHVVRNGDPGKYFNPNAEIIERSYYFAHQEHAYLETEGVVAIPEPDGSVTVFANNQSPHINRDNTAAVLGLEPEQVRIIQPPVGGSFGGKDDVTYQATAQAAKLALLTGRPVRLVHSREESMAASYKREAMQIDLKIAADKSGIFKAARAQILADSGAYASMTPLSAWRATMHAAGAYHYEAASVDTKVIYTNNGYSGAFRGFGNTQAAAASEMMVDEIAEIFGQDPIDFRLRNCLKNGDRAFTGNALEEGVNIDRCLEWVRKVSDWDTKRRKYFDQPVDVDIRRGIGVAGYFHGSGLGGEGVDYARITMEIEPDNSIMVQSGLTDYGQGSRTVFSLLAAEAMGVSKDRIYMPRPDTQTALESGPTVASRTSIVGGNAVLVASRKLSNLLLLAAADELGCEKEQVRRFGECFTDPEENELSFDEVVKHAREMGMQLFVQGYWEIPRIHWDFDKGTGIPYFAYSYGAQVAELEVNRQTGDVSLLAIWACHDGGRVLFPNGAKGQMIGGIAQGIGYALTEGFTFEQGIPQKLNYDRYHIPRAIEVPEIDVHFIDAELEIGPYGAKNMAEPVMIATAPAIVNALYQATGARIRKLPVDRGLLIQK